jgi:hypothetical protein
VTDLSLILEEITEMEAQVFRLKGSFNSQDNGVKQKKLAVLTRTLDRLKREKARLERTGEAA